MIANGKNSPWYLQWRVFRWWEADTLVLEAMSGILAWFFVIRLLMPDHALEAQQLAPMLVIMPEWGWVAMFALVAVCQSLAACGNISIFRYPGLLFGLGVWTTVAVVSFMVFPGGFRGGPYAIFALFTGWALVKGPYENGKG